MEIKNIEEAKKYINKNIYYIDIDKNKIIKLYIGGIHLFYNQVDYDVLGFECYIDKKCTDNWGKIEIEDLKNYINKDESYGVYTFSEKLANDYLPIIFKNNKESYKIQAIQDAKRILDEYNIKYEIFD